MRIYIIMFRAWIMWLNIQLFQFLIADYPRYCQEWTAIRRRMQIQETRKAERRRNRTNHGCCGGDDVEDDEKYQIQIAEMDEGDVGDNHLSRFYNETPNALSKSTSCSSSASNSSSNCDSSTITTSTIQFF